MISLVAPSYSHADREAVWQASTDLSDTSCLRALEDRLTAMYGAAGTVLTTSGTAAIHLALTALDYAYWLIPSYSCVALLNAVRLTPAEVMLADSRYNPEQMDYNVSSGAGIVASMFGVRRYGHNIEDLAMALGATPAVIQGRCAVLSFHFSKIISGQHGGAVVINDHDLLARLRDLNSYDAAIVADRLNPEPKYVQRVNYQMSNLTAALVLSQLDRLPEFIARRRQIADYYNAELAECPVILPTKIPAGSVFGRYVMALTKHHPVDVIRRLEEYGIEAGRGVWPLLHNLLGLPDKDFPNATKAGQTVLSLPVYPALSDGDVENIAEATRSILCA